MAQGTINNGESGTTVRGKINDNFTELYANKIDLETSETYPAGSAYRIAPILTTGNSQADLEILNLGNQGGNTENRNLVPAGIVRGTGSMLIYRNMKWNNSTLRWETPYQQADAYGSACYEAGGEASILHASPAAVNFGDVPHEILLASANGTDGETNNRVTTGYYTQSKAPIFARFNSTAYSPASTNNCWNQVSGVDPLLWLSSAETKNTENELARLETNSATAGAWPGMYFAKSRGTLASRLTAADTDVLGFIGFKGYDGDEYEISAGIRVVVEGTVSNNVVPARIDFQTSATDSAGRTTRFSITNDGKIIIASIPTSSAGLSAGTLWSNSGVITIV